MYEVNEKQYCSVSEHKETRVKTVTVNRMTGGGFLNSCPPTSQYSHLGAGQRTGPTANHITYKFVSALGTFPQAFTIIFSNSLGPTFHQFC